MEHIIRSIGIETKLSIIKKKKKGIHADCFYKQSWQPEIRGQSWWEVYTSQICPRFHNACSNSNMSLSPIYRLFDLILCSVCAGKTVDQHNHLHDSVQFLHSFEVMNRLKQQLKIKSCNSHDINSYDFHAVLI